MIRGLVDGLKAVGEVRVEVYGDRGGGETPPDHRLTFVRRALRPVLGNARRVVADQVGLGWAARWSAADLVHSPHGVVPLAPPRPWVVSLWDTSPLNPDFACGPPPMRRYRSWCFSRAVEQADHVIVPSQSVRSRLIEHFGLAEDRVTTIYPLFGPMIQRSDSPSEEPRHLLHVGTLEPRKNLDLLLDAYELLDPVSRPPLLLAGRYGWRQRALVQRIDGMGPSVRWLGRVDDAELGRLYRQAYMVVQPSRDEGFDLPVVEGLASGAPVVASDIPVHREVAGDLALFALADDAPSLAAAILDVLGWDRDRRFARSVVARARAARLASSDPVAEHIEVYRRLAGR